MLENPVHLQRYFHIMKNRGKILLLLLVCCPALVKCPSSRIDDAARIHFFIGNIDILSAGKKIQPVVGGVLGKNDIIETAQKSSCDILFADMMLVRIGEKSRAAVGKIKEEIKEEMGTALNLSHGRIMVIFNRLGRESVLRVKGTTVTIAVRGTVFALGVEENRSAVSVLEGTVEMEIRGADARMKKIGVGPGAFAEITREIIEDVLAGKKGLPVRELSIEEKSVLIDELSAMQRESVGSLPPSMRSAFEDEIAKVMKSESAEQKINREAALRKAEEARRKAELEALKKKQEEARLKKQAEEAERRKKEEEKKRLEEARKAAAKKAAQQKQKADRSTDTSGN